MYTKVITIDGNYHINKKHKDARSAVYASGTFGTAAVKLTYIDSSGLHIDYKEGVVLTGDQIQLEHGSGMEVYATVSGSNPSTKIEIKCAGVD